MKKSILLLGAIFILAVCGFCYTNVNKTVKAEDTPTVEITNYNLAFQNTIYIMYAVETNVQDVENIKILTWRTPQEEYLKGTEDSVLKYYITEDVGGEDKPVFVYTRLTLKEMTEYVYARPYYTKDGQDYYGEAVKYSILDYACDRLNNSTDEKFKNMVSTMLLLGSQVQEYNNYNLDRLPNSTYYRIEIENGSLEDGFTYGLITGNERVKLKADGDKNLVVFWKNFNGESFANVEVSPKMIQNDYELSYKTAFLGGDLAYKKNDDGKGYTVTGLGDCTDVHIVIPSTYEGLPVTAIGENAFYSKTNLKSVTIQENVTAIGESAFYDCWGITDVFFSNGLKTIGRRAFSSCSDLTSITIPNSVTSIGDNAFGFCKGLTSLTMPDSGITIGDTAFGSCNNLITADDTGRIIYVKCNDNPYFLLQRYPLSADYVINENTKIIGDKAFLDCGMHSVTMPNGLTTIGNQAFSGCNSLNNVVIPQSVTLIGYGAFSGIGMTGLYTITLPFIGAMPNDTTNTYIGYLGGESSYIEHDFNTSKPALKYVTISSSNSITIGDYAFCNTWLKTLTLNCEVTQIGDYAFDGCENLTDITFNGTQEEWNAVINNKKIWGDSGKPSSTKVTIHCSDGDIEVYRDK